MKKKTMTRTVSTLISTAVVLLSLSSCSGVIGGRNSVLISVPELAHKGSGRFVTTDVTTGYIVVTKKNKVFSSTDYDESAYFDLINGEAYITDLPVGDCIFGVVLFSSTNAVTGMAVKEVNIQPGFNRVPIRMGPGFDTFKIDSRDISNPMRPKNGFGVSFAHDTMIVDYGRDETKAAGVDFVPTFGAISGGNRRITGTVGRFIGGSKDGEEYDKSLSNTAEDKNDAPRFTPRPAPRAAEDKNDTDAQKAATLMSFAHLMGSIDLNSTANEKTHANIVKKETPAKNAADAQKAADANVVKAEKVAKKAATKNAAKAKAADAASYQLPPDAEGIEFTITDDENEEYTYRLILR